MLPVLPLTAQNRRTDMAGLKRSRTLPTDGHVAKFLYTIMKQLDLKKVKDRTTSYLKIGFDIDY